MKKAQFIVIEGLEGAGKSTAVNFVKRWLLDHGIEKILTTREPGGTPLAESIRKLVKSVHHTEQVTSQTELLLMYAARSQLVSEVIKPALAKGEWVICDRFYWSTFAYQGGGRNIPMDIILPIHKATLGDFTPHITLYMDIDPVIGMQRVRQRGALDRFEQQEADFFQRVHQSYLTFAKTEKTFKTINAQQTLAQVQQEIAKVLERYDSQ